MGGEGKTKDGGREKELKIATGAPGGGGRAVKKKVGGAESYVEAMTILIYFINL